MKVFITMTVMCSWLTINAQQNIVSLEEAISITRQKNKNIEAADLNIRQQQQLKRTGADIGKTNVTYMRGQYNSYFKEDNNITITQSIPFPTVISSELSLGRSLVKGSELQKAVTENEMIHQVKQVYYQLIYLSAKEALLLQQDSIFGNFVKASDLRYRTGESNLLEKATAETQRSEALNTLAQTRGDIVIYETMLQTLMNAQNPVHIAPTELHERTLSGTFDSMSFRTNPRLALLKQQVEVANGEQKVAANKVLPEITIGYFNQTLIGTPRDESGALAISSDRFQGFQIGLALPLFVGPQAARVKAASINQDRQRSLYEYSQNLVNGQLQQAMQEYSKNKLSVDYYQKSALQNAQLILRQADLAFRNGEIAYTEYWLALRSAFQIRDNYLNNLNNLNQSVINLEFLAGIQ